MAVRTVTTRTRVVTSVSKDDLKFQIDQLRKDKMIFDLHCIVVSFLAVLTAVFLPELIYRVIYGAGQTQADLSSLAWIPVAAYAVAAVYTLVSMLMNMMRWKKIKKLEHELSMA